MKRLSAWASGLRRTWTSVQRRPARVVVATAAIAALLFVIVLVQLAAFNATQLTRAWAGGAHMVVYLDADVPEARATAVHDALTKLPGVVTADRLSAEQSVARLREAMGEHDRELLDGIEPGVIPGTIEVVFSAGLTDVAKIHPILDKLENTPGIAHVELAGDWVTKAAALSRTLRLAAWGLIGLIAIALVVAMFVLTGLALRDTRRESDVLSLMGASNGFIRFPLILRGTLQGALGGVLALLLALLAYRAAAGTASDLLANTFQDARLVFLPSTQLLTVVAAGAALGFFGSWLATRRHALV